MMHNGGVFFVVTAVPPDLPKTQVGADLVQLSDDHQHQ